MSKEKKGAKFGRGTRSASAKMQKARTERNKRAAVDRHERRMAKKAAHRASWESKRAAHRKFAA